jgi:hypothetical protein
MLLGTSISGKSFRSVTRTQRFWPARHFRGRLGISSNRMVKGWICTSDRYELKLLASVGIRARILSLSTMIFFLKIILFENFIAFYLPMIRLMMNAVQTRPTRYWIIRIAANLLLNFICLKSKLILKKIKQVYNKQYQYLINFAVNL